MQKVLLVFPDVKTMAEFVVKQQVNHAEVNSLEQTLIATIPDEKIQVAEKIYGAFLKSIIPKN
jgi:hypothetical protein